MPIRNSQFARRGFWSGPAILGVALIVIGLLIFWKPQLLAYVVAATFVSAGMTMIGVGMRLRGNTTFRAFDMRAARRDEL